LNKHNGHWKPDNRAHYLYGESLPIAEKDLSSTIKRMMDDLHVKAGKGPICQYHRQSQDRGLTVFQT